MGYKTFEDMKHNIPEGATHYHNESDDYHFCWFKVDGNKWFVNCPDKNEKWYACYREQYRDGIVQFIQTESPQEREALDMIDNTSKQVESLANNSELPILENGTACIHDSIYGFAVFLPEGLFFKPKDMNKLFSVKPSELSKAEPESKKYDRAVGGPIKLSLPEWSGEGLPYAGVECECFCFDESKWLKVKVLDAITGSKEVAVAVICHGNRYRKVFWGVKFRPIETPEQKAERERLDEINEIASFITSLPTSVKILPKSLAERIHDAGYRKGKK